MAVVSTLMRVCLALASWLSLVSGCGDARSELGTQRTSSDSPATTPGSVAEAPGQTAVSTEGTGDESCQLPTDAAFRIAEPSTPAEELFNQLLESELAKLYTLIGRYMNGEVPVFQGPLRAIESKAGVLEKSIDSQRVVAVVHSREKVDEFTAPNREMLVFDNASESMLRFYQYSAVGSPTAVSTLASFYSSGGMTVMCSNCLPVLALVKDNFEMALSLQGKYLDESALELEITGAFDRIPADALTLDDLLTVNSTAESPDFGKRAQLRDEADVFVFDRRGTQRTEAAKDSDGCYQTVDYRLEWFVRKDCLKAYGLRNLVSETPRTVCPSTEG